MEITALSGRIGARVDGIDLSEEPEPSVFERLCAALFEFKVLQFPRQALTPAAQVALGRRFGELVENHPDYPTIDGHEAVMVIENGPERPPDNETWHKDMTYRPDPPQCSLLHARALPSRGGDTMFADMEAVLEDLSPSLRNWLETLSVEHDQVYGFEPTLVANGEFERLETMKNRPSELWCNVHPAIGVHPVTGKRYLGVDECFARRIVELAAAESDALLRLLRERIRQPRYQLRLRWEVDDLVVWDNVPTLHYAVGDYRDYRRMQRVTVARYHAAS